MLILDFSKHLVESHYLVRGVRFAPDGRTLAAVFGPEGGASEAGWWDFAAGGVLATSFVYPHANCDEGVDPAFAPDLGRCAAHGHEDTASVDYVSLLAPGQEYVGLDGDTLSCSNNPEATYAGLAALAFTPDGKHLLVAHDGGDDEAPAVAVHRVAAPGVAGRKRPAGRDIPVAGGTPTALAVSPDGKRFACGTADRTVQVVALVSGKVVADLAVPGPAKAKQAERAVRGLVFSPDGKLLAARAGGRVTVFDIAAGEAVVTLAEKGLTDVAFHPDGRRLMTSGPDDAIRMWDTAGWREVGRYAWKIGPVHSVAFAADGLTAAAGGEKSRVVVWDVDA